MIRIRPYRESDERSWVYTKALSYLFSSFFDDRETRKPPLDTEVFEDRIALVADQDGQVVGLLDIDIYNAEYSRSYCYAPADKVAYFSNLAVHPDYQGRGIAQALFEKAKQSLITKKVEKLAIFTRDGDKANYLYQKWGGRLVCQDRLVIGSPKTTVMPHFDLDLDHHKLKLTDEQGNPVPYYLREGISILAEDKDLDLFDVEESYLERTYVIDLLSYS